MALYDFLCVDCAEEFEVFSTGFIKDEQKVCPVCGSPHVRQKYSSFLRSGSASASASGCAVPAGSGFG
jgi:putative FmdB family regulatory protein